ncbi:MAG: molybdopterin molybdenumtransferase MoeA [Marinilabiliales bacterium]|nr:MAG: molybdopterin molybdenumtransferase MoeA [Marinilabiliales bacterium]
MISSEEAYDLVMKSAHVLEKEGVDIDHALGRVLAEDIVSDIDMPPFNKSAMDGYACRKADLDKEMTIIEVIAAGDTPAKNVGEGECTKIMTGAPVPEGADCVIMVEHTELTDEGKVRFVQENTNINICYTGEDVSVDDLVLKEGTLIAPKHIAILASVGAVKPIVFRKPKVGIITTGSELVEPYETPGLSKIRNSNGYQLVAQVKSACGQPKYYGIVEDTEDATYNTLVEALIENDVVLMTGGVSMGDYDFVPKIMERTNNEILFDSVAVQPGRPTTFGVIYKKYCF